MPRAFFHDYRSRCIYHITINKTSDNKTSEAPVLSELAGGVENVRVELSPLGKIIVGAIFEIQKREPAIRNLQYVIMPDHIHLLLFVTRRLSKSLGSYIGMLKVLIGQRYRDQAGQQTQLFEPDYYDRILHPTRKLDTIFNYIRQNPYRLAVRRAFPDFFTRCSNIRIADTLCQAYGNLHLLQNPFKDQVIVHRSDTKELYEHNRDRWLHNAANGGVLVSPFISRPEKTIRAEAEALGSRIILIVNQPFHDRFKPAAHDFDLCTKGRLLIIAPNQPLPFSRTACLKMNALAAEISKY